MVECSLFPASEVYPAAPRVNSAGRPGRIACMKFAACLAAAALMFVALPRNAGAAEPVAAVAAARGVVNDDVAWDMDSLARVVRPLTNDPGDRWPMILWSLPLPRGDALVKMREDGSLRKHIDTLAARGMVPT